MIIKKFQGKTENDATAAAVKELGSSVVIMNVKTTKPKGFFSFLKPTIVEVTAAVEEETDNPPVNKKEAVNDFASSSAKTSNDKPRFKDIILEAEQEEKNTSSPAYNQDISAKIESLHSLLEKQLEKSEKVEEVKEAPEEKNGDKKSEMLRFFKLIYNTLLENQVDERYANDIIGELEQMNRPGITIDQLLSSIYQKMILMFGQAAPIKAATNGPKYVFFVGPTGVGKTTTIAKIASLLCVEDKKKVALITTDTYRIAAADQLKVYANILESPFKIVYTTEELISSCDEYKDCDYVLVDTAGHSPKNIDLKEGTKQFLHALDGKVEMEVFLVLSSTTKYKDLKSISDVYSEMTDYKLIFTKLDETSEIGNLWNIKRHTGAEMSYVTTGQNVPDDIAIFNPQRTVKQLLGGDR